MLAGLFTNAVRDGGEVVRDELQLALGQLRRSASAIGLVAIAVVLVLAGVVLAGAVGAFHLAQAMGWTATLLLVAGTLLTLAGAVFLASRRVLDRARSAGERSGAGEEHEKEGESMVSAQQPRSGDGNGQPGRGPHEGSRSADTDRGRAEESVVTKVIDYAMKHPVQVACGGFAVVAMLGPFRTLKLAGRGVAAASMLASVVKSFENDQRGGESAQRETDEEPAAVKTPQERGASVGRGFV